jgi:hypothetical protein
VPTDHTNIIIISDLLTEVGAFALERRMIEWYGRKDIKSGILLNRTNGGDGTSGHRRKTKRVLSTDTKQKISVAHLGLKKFSDEQKLCMSINRSRNKWWNDGKQQIFSPEPPSRSWIRGRLNFDNIGLRKAIETNRLRHWWTNGKDNKFAIKSPGPEYHLGRIIASIFLTYFFSL